ncbi:MAG TPA: hypothetical protein VFE02_16245 [Candidatus Acidoferrales bacterium]|nr:hypothetical protein [Candidatus Acidoferrales bacterium]
MSCTPTDVTLLGTSQCTASVINLSSTLVNWSVSGTGTGTITAGGLYTAPATIPNTTSNVVTITATSQVQSTLTATQSLTLLPPTAITNVTCVDTHLAVATKVSSGGQISCSATASTGALVPVNWSVSNKNNAGVTTNLGSISSQGIYTAALVPPPGQVVTITATSQAQATQTLTTTINVVFGNAALSGSYVFSTTGRLPTHAYWARTGSFSLGGGSLSGIEDINQGGTPNTVITQRSFTGSYSIGDDGRGTMQFCEGTSAACPLGSPATAYFNIAVFSTSQPSVNQAQMIEFSAPGSTSAPTIAGGEMLSQSQSVFSAGTANLSGTYSFDFSGITAAGTSQSNIGDFVANGHGSIAAGSTTPGTVAGEIDTNITGSAPSQAAIASTSYSVSANGRGTMVLNGLSFSFYPISAGRAKFIEIDTPSPSILQGDAYIQQNSSTCGWGVSALNGLAAYQTSGSSAAGVIGDLGSFTASSSGSTGTIGTASIDENNAGAVTSTVGTLTGSYMLDACGRGTLSVGSHNYVFYIISSSNAVLQETTSGVSAHGLLLPSQGGPFVDTTLTGSYAFRLAGTDAAGANANREDFVGQLMSAGTGTGLTGTLDLNDFGTTQASVGINGGSYPPPAAGIRETMMLPFGTTPPSTRNFVFYMVSPTLFYVLDTDTTGTALGVINKQF